MGNVQDHSVKETTSEKPSISHPSSAFRLVKPSKSNTINPKYASKFYRERPFFEDVKTIARGFGDILEFSQKSDASSSQKPVYSSHEDLQTYEFNDLISNDKKFREKRIKRKPDRRITVHDTESLFREHQLNNFDMPEAKISSSIMADSGKLERIKKYKEERRKQLAAQSLAQLNPKNMRTLSKKADDQMKNGDKGKSKGAPSTTPPPAVVRTTRTSRLRAAALTGDTKPLDTKSTSNLEDLDASNSSLIDSLCNKSVSNIDIDVTNVNRRVLSDNAVILGNSDLSNVNVEQENKNCDINSVISLSACISNEMTLSTASDGDKKSQKSKANGALGPVTPSGATKQPNRIRTKDHVGDESAVRRSRLISTKSVSKAENGVDNSLNSSSGKFAPSSCKTRNEISAHPERNSPRSSSQSPLSSVSTLKLQQKRKSVELSPKSFVTNKPTEIESKSVLTDNNSKSITKKSSENTSLPEIVSKNIRSNSKTRASHLKIDAKKDNLKSADLSGDAELSRIKRRSSSLSSDTRHRNATSEDTNSKPKRTDIKMAPGFDKTVKSQRLANVEQSSETKTKPSSLSTKTYVRQASNRRLTSRMDALAALTKETLARVDRLTRKPQDPQNNSDLASSKLNDNDSAFIAADNCDKRLEKNEQHSNVSMSKTMLDKLNDIDAAAQHLLDFEKENLPNSIADSKSSVIHRKQSESSASMLSYTPVSILKRKSLQEDHGSSGASSGTVATPPVTFSPSVIDSKPQKSRRHGQSILKKRRSLDESQVHRHRSCSPEVAFIGDTRSRPILKSQRRSSLEEVIRGRSPDGNIQGILKRKCSRDGDFVEDGSLGSPEPQGILKRKSNSSSGSSTASSHVSIAQAVILAAAKGAILVEDKDGVRPILKKKSFSEEKPCTEIYNFDGPRPILKKKSLTESDYSDHDKPTKTILKSGLRADDGNSSSFDQSEDDRSSRRSSLHRHRTDSSDCESAMKPILKQGQSREQSPSSRPHLMLCTILDPNTFKPENVNRIDCENAEYNSPPDGSPRRQSDDDELPKNSKFSGRLQSPSLVKDFVNAPDEDEQTSPVQLSPHFPSVVLRRRDLRPRDPDRSKSSVSSFSDELHMALNSRRSIVNESCPDADNVSESSRETSPEKHSPKVPQTFPSIAERIQSMEQYLVKSNGPREKPLGAVPKRQFRSKERFRTQPVTVEELRNLNCLDVGQANFQRHEASQATSAKTVDAGSESLLLTSRCVNDDTLAHRRPRIGQTSQSSSKNIDTPDFNKFYLEDSALSERVPHSIKNNEPLADFHRSIAKLRSLENISNSSPPNKVKSFSDLTFTPENLKNFNDNSLTHERVKSEDHIDDNSPVTREFNRLFNHCSRDSKNPNSLNFSGLVSELEGEESLDPYSPKEQYPSTIDNVDKSSFNQSFPKYEDNLNYDNKSKLKHPNKLFDSETGYQQGSREAALQELDRLEIELEDVRVALDADSSALCGVDADHWSLNVSVDSGVFNRMSSADSGPLSGEEPSLQQDLNRSIVTNINCSTSPVLNQEVSDIEAMSKTIDKHLISENNHEAVEKSYDPVLKNMEKENSPDAVDNPQDLFGLMKSNSVSARASMWQQIQMQANKAAVKPTVRHARSKVKDGSSVLDRFKTQPITMGEVNNAVNENSSNSINQSRSSFDLSLEQDDDAKLDENDPAKLTLAEKMKLFGTTVSPKPPTGVRKTRSPRFQTMPILSSQVEDAKELNRQQNPGGNKKMNLSLPIGDSKRLSLSSDKDTSLNDDDSVTMSVAERLHQFNLLANSPKTNDKPIYSEESKLKKELGTNFRFAQNKLAEQASRMLTSEVRGILKSRSGAIPLLPSASEGSNLSRQFNPKGKADIVLPPINRSKEDSPPKSKNTNGSESYKKVLKAEGLKDEGIESSSDDESVSHSSHSSDQSCSSSDSSEESDEDRECTPQQKHINPSNLKSSRTDSDLTIKSKVLKAVPKVDTRIKLPCMDEVRARQIMERCMARDKDKENIQKHKNVMPQNTTKNLKIESTQLDKKIAANKIIAESAFVKLKNIKNGSESNEKYSEDDIINTSVLPEKVSKYFPSSVSKSKSVHVLSSAYPGETKLSPITGQKSPVKLRSPVTDLCEGSGSDGESSGGREVRYINSRRRNVRNQPIAPLAAPPVKWGPEGLLPQGLRRSATQPMAATVPHNGSSIAERLRALQQSGNSDWRKRLSRRLNPDELSPDEDVTNVITAAKNRINETLNQQHEKKRAIQIEASELATDILISERRNKLETSAQDWKKRVGANDASLFSVAGRMDRDKAPPSPVVQILPPVENLPVGKKTPVAARFKSRRAEANNIGPLKSASSATVSQPASPLKAGIGEFRRSISVSGVDDLAVENNSAVNPMTKSQDGSVNGSTHAGSSVPVPRADDETFTSFFTSASQTILTSSSSYIPYNNNNNDIIQIDEDIDLDAIDSSSRHMLGGAAANRVRAARRAGGSRNPLRALAARTDLRQEYTELPSTGVADKETARLKKDKIALNSPMAVEALAGLASREDFAAINLKKANQSSPPCSDGTNSSKPPILIHVKGRRRVQARLVEPTHNSINSGDCYILVTPNQVFNYAGYYANVIERSRSADIALHIHTAKDLGCSNSPSVITLDEHSKNRSMRHLKQFWNLLGVSGDTEDFIPTPAGNADEDEIFESGIIPTNMCYEVIDDELVPIQEYWGQIPKIAMLDPSKILVFDFGSELYVWNGKNTILERRRMAFQLAQELWDEGYDYKDCVICPINTSQVLGARTEPMDVSKRGTERPPWAMITKVTQHMENILFKDKFLDWPDFSRVIKVKEEEDSLKSGVTEIKPYDAEIMIEREYEDPSLELEGSHVGRGTYYYDKETMRHFEVKTKSITKWVIQDNDYMKMDDDDLGQFYSGDSYILRWEYQLNATGRELNGKPSKHNLTGRDRCAYFCWQGKDASANERGAAALLTVELDHEKGPQECVAQGSEYPAFLNLFKGSLIIHQGKKGSDKSKHKLYMLRGNVANECHLIQVSCSMRQLRSRASMLLVDTAEGHINVWHGAKSLKHTKSLALDAAKLMASKYNRDIFKCNIDNIKVTEINEGDEPKSVIEILGGANRQLYHSSIEKDNKNTCNTVTTPRLFHFTDLSGQFVANEILSPLRHESLATPYPFSQQELYSASQPGLFLLDNEDTLWLWQGWIPQSEDEEIVEVGAVVGSIRWQGCRKAAMETVLRYWELLHPDIKEPKAILVVAGLEPLQFTNLFDIWQDRDDIAEINIVYGHKIGDGLCNVSEELCRLSRTSFPLAILRQRPLPDGVDPANIERYLNEQQFDETFGMKKEEFYDLPSWKQANMKKELGLF